MSNTNMDEKPDYIELMLKVNVLGPMLVILQTNNCHHLTLIK